MALTTPVVRYCRKPGRQPAGPHLSLWLTGRIDSKWVLHFKNQFRTLVNRFWLTLNRFAGPLSKPFLKQNQLGERPNRFTTTFSNHFLLCPLMNRFWNPSNRLETLRKLFQEKDHRQNRL
ncbi:hypothetical protein PIB30_102656 [Stylosanthes scabra]|uniref:Uncharacterized protein n=1 Tax=Stylosanthes scabra TaxID=79078 RepID=A0ABU6XVA5_9FABA|nr:hypothetical protein [Stylosanthes scabra]